MCLMLYIGTAEELPLEANADLRVEEVEPGRRVVSQWFTQPSVRFVGAHTGCSCGFPSVIADSLIEYYDGMPFDSDDRAADLRSVRALLELVDRAGARSGRVELFPVADGDEGKPPRGIVEWRREMIEPARFFFNEHFMHRVDIGTALAARR